MEAGWNVVAPGTHLLCLGEMGIGNTTAAAAIAAALFEEDGRAWVGRGTGVDDEGLARKAAAVDAGLARHRAARGDPLAIAAALGGRELAALLGATLAARHHCVPVLLDGFVSPLRWRRSRCSSRARWPMPMPATSLPKPRTGGCLPASACRRCSISACGSAEASGACLAVNILRAALDCHAGMASFAEAGVSDRA